MKDIRVSFPGGKRVDAQYDGFVVHTDQSVAHGGAGSAPEPFDLFFVSLATCVGIYALEFCNTRGLNTDGLGVRLQSERDAEQKRYPDVRITITLPAAFPEKYRSAIVRAADLCTVKKHILTPPAFAIDIADP
jgi:ribosomal protein S12 methylthiotransferase accessory factor